MMLSMFKGNIPGMGACLYHAECMLSQLVIVCQNTHYTSIPMMCMGHYDGASTNNYFHYQFFYRFLFKSQFLKGDVFKCLWQSKTQRYSDNFD